MAEPATARETLFALRRKIARIEGRLPDTLEPAAGGAAAPDTASVSTGPVLVRRDGAAVPDLLPTGAARLDAALGGGVPLAALTEIHAAQTRDAGAASGFALALAALADRDRARPLLWIATTEILREAGTPYAPGLLSTFGIGPERLLLAPVARVADALWVAEEAARLTALGVVMLELRGNPAKLDLTATRRLHHRAREAGHPVLLVRPGAAAEPTAAPLRLVVSPAPAASRHGMAGPLARSIGAARFDVAIGKSRTARPQQFLLEWNSDELTFFERRAEDARHLVSLPSDRADSAHAAGTVVAFASAAG